MALKRYNGIKTPIQQYDWRQMWPDQESIAKCDTRTLCEWNLWLPEPKTDEELELWNILRTHLLYTTTISTQLQTAEGILICRSLLEFHRLAKFQVNLATPYIGKLDEYGLSSIVNYYLSVNTETNGFLAHLMKNIFEQHGYMRVKALLFPHIQDFKHVSVETILKFKDTLNDNLQPTSSKS